ncbi:hypothetical protein QMK19_09165 [Streptomyces sp. H10-C2]|uniref:hypothetical protein n=1 Tax=unclassified Streptomyces TaxID=2593676 RepID=UPI0024BB5743|nr:MULTISPECIES: hypothetical protein [unclassified Streptomyces]MDJ0340924.1 hypothetical protein [Streptomyces sp. PH10-H1]MDJ0369844.1 hypothetical protein [Streptomyces sp. H10-C2]
MGPTIPRTGDGHRSAGRRFLVGTAATTTVALIAAGVVLVTVDGHPERAGPQAITVASGPPGPAGPELPPAVRTETARWIAQHVGSGQVVACDAAVCGSLAALGFPASSMVWVKASALELQSADIAVLTSTLRTRLGAAVLEVTAAEPLAAFGSGPQQVTVQAVAHAGRASYSRAMAADLADRRLAGRALLANSRVTVAAPARTPLEQGLVDMRVCALLATLSSGHTLTVESFGAAAPGAGPGVPRSAVDITAIDTVSAVGTAGPATALRALIAAQQAPYRPLKTVSRAARADSPAVLSLLYSQPAPVNPQNDPAP